MTKKQKLEKARYHNSAQIHVRKRLAQRYPKIYKGITMKDLKEAPFLRLFSNASNTRITTVVLVNDNLIFLVQSLSKNMIHTVLTKEQVTERIAELNLDITLEESLLREGISSKYNTYTQFMKVRK